MALSDAAAAAESWLKGFIWSWKCAIYFRHGRECGSSTHNRIRKKRKYSFFLFVFICLPTEFLPALGPTERWCAFTLGTALLISSRAGSDLGLVSRLVWGLCQLGSSSQVWDEIKSVFLTSNKCSFYTKWVA